MLIIYLHLNFSLRSHIHKVRAQEVIYKWVGKSDGGGVHFSKPSFSEMTQHSKLVIILIANKDL